MDEIDPVAGPKRVVGHKLLGYSATKNHEAELVGLARTPAEAMALVDEKVSYTLEWRLESKNPDGHEGWKGGDPRALAQDDYTMSAGGLYKREPGPDLNIHEGFGHSRWWDRFYVEAVTEPVLEDIPGAEFIGHFGYYVAPAEWLPGHWDVRYDLEGGDFGKLATLSSREEAMAWAWNDIVKQQRHLKKIERRMKWWSFVAEIFSKTREIDR